VVSLCPANGRERGPTRAFYEAEALRGGWSVRQLDRQIATLFYERTLLSRDKAAMLAAGAAPRSEDAISPEEALIYHLESFLLELGDGFTFVARQRRLRIGDA
jgi:predicted nuclease of restriction endonuclease-like (RecB) superfamily